jgi:hypothetical protein
MKSNIETNQTVPEDFEKKLSDAISAKERIIKSNNHSQIRESNLLEAPLSFAQQRLWIINQYDPESLAYCIN